MAPTRSRTRRPALLAAVTLVALLGAGCATGSTGPLGAPLENGGPGALGTPAPAPNVTPAPPAVPTSAVVAGLPTPSPAAPTASPAAPAATPAAARATTTEPTPRVTAEPVMAEGSLRLALTEPIDVDVTLPADVQCDVGRTYHMFTHAELEGEGVEVTVDIPLYHGPDDYLALVRVMVGTPEGTQGGEIPGVLVTMVSDTKGRAEFSYSGANGSVD